MSENLTQDEKNMIQILKNVKTINAVEVSKVSDININNIAMTLISLFGKGYIRKGTNGFYLVPEKA